MSSLSIPPGPTLFQVLLDDYLAAVRAGRAPDAARLLDACPELAAYLPVDAFAPALTADYHPAGAAWPTQPVPPTPSVQGVTGVPGYEILGELGRGGMGVVYKARQLGLNRTVALKMILAAEHAGETQLARFRSEAEAVARLRQPHIVQIHEVGEADGRPFFSLEFCPGGSLERLLGDGPMPLRSAAELVEKLARAVHYAHGQGVVHRDLKPANVLLMEDGTPKITDFGLAKRLDSDDGQTHTGQVMGTPGYMAPEQASGHSKLVGPAADVYSLGAILYQLLTGRPPFRGATPLETLVQVLESEPVPPRRLNAKVSRGLERLCLQCLEKEPERRPASAGDLADALGRFLGGEEVLAGGPAPLQMLRRWVRREPALASRLTAFALCSAVLYLKVALTGDASMSRAHPQVRPWHVQAVLAAWAALSFAGQWALPRGWAARWVPYTWAVSDVLLMTAILALTDGISGPLSIGYPLLIAGAGLWSRVRLVWFTTACVVIAYVVTLETGLAADTVGPEFRHRHIYFLVGLAVLAAITAYQVQRLRALGRSTAT